MPANWKKNWQDLIRNQIKGNAPELLVTRVIFSLYCYHHRFALVCFWISECVAHWINTRLFILFFVKKKVKMIPSWLKNALRMEWLTTESKVSNACWCMLRKCTKSQSATNDLCSLCVNKKKIERIISIFFREFFLSYFFFYRSSSI